MRYTLIGAICLIAAGSAHAQTPPDRSPLPPASVPEKQPDTSVPDKQADTSVPRNGLIQPAPGATTDATVRPPNVDPGMAIAPPGTTGGTTKGGTTVVPK